MVFSGFDDWLINEKGMSMRSAKDVISRCRRICKYTDSKDIEPNAIDLLNSNYEFNNQTIFIKSQLRRAIVLWNEYKAN